MNTNGVGTGFHRRSWAEVERLVSEFQQSGLGRKPFCAARGLNVHTLDAWRKRIASSGSRQEIVPVEIVAERAVQKIPARTASPATNMQRRFASQLPCKGKQLYHCN